jgi:hypothetical protein
MQLDVQRSNKQMKLPYSPEGHLRSNHAESSGKYWLLHSLSHEGKGSCP